MLLNLSQEETSPTKESQDFSKIKQIKRLSFASSVECAASRLKWEKPFFSASLCDSADKTDAVLHKKNVCGVALISALISQKRDESDPM